MTQTEKSEWSRIQKGKTTTEPIKRVMQPHVRARGNFTATSSTDCLRTHAKSQMLCLGIHLPPVSIRVPGLSSWEEEQQVQYSDIKQKLNWTVFGFVWFFFVLHWVIYKTPISDMLLPCHLSVFAYSKKKKSLSTNIKNGPQLRFPALIASGFRAQGNHPHVLLCKTNPQITGWWGKQTPPCPAIEIGKKKTTKTHINIYQVFRLALLR